MICWGGLSFVTAAASGWQMVVRYGSNGGNLRKGEEGRDKTVGRVTGLTEREHTRAGSIFLCEMLHFEGTRMLRYLASRSWTKERERDKRRKR